MNEASKLTFYANRPPRTQVLQCDRIIRTGNKQLRSLVNLLIESGLKGEL